MDNVNDIYFKRFVKYLFNKELEDLTKEEIQTLKEQILESLENHRTLRTKEKSVFVIRKRVDEGLSFSEIAKLLNLSQTRVRNIWESSLSYVAWYIKEMRLPEQERYYYKLDNKIEENEKEKIVTPESSVFDILTKYASFNTRLYNSLFRHFDKLHLEENNFKQIKDVYIKQQLEFRMGRSTGYIRNLGVGTMKHFDKMMEDIRNDFPEEYNKYDKEIFEDNKELIKIFVKFINEVEGDK